MSFNTKSYDLMKQLVDSEKESAISSYGAIYNSNHEGYAVLLEEIEETEHELSEIKKHLQQVWENIKHDEKNIAADLVLVALASESLILESAQIHAVTDKFIQTVKPKIEE